MKIQIFEANEVRKVLEDIINTKEEVRIVGFSDIVYQCVGEEQYTDFQNNRIKATIKRRIIADIKLRGDKLLDFPLTDVKFLSSEMPLPPRKLIIYKDRTNAIFPFEEPKIIQITDGEYSDAYKEYFEKLWSISEK